MHTIMRRYLISPYVKQWYFKEKKFVINFNELSQYNNCRL